jgi:hypothetical protein
MPDKQNLFTLNEQVKFLQEIRCSRLGVSESSAVWKQKKENPLRFIVKEPKKAVVGLLNAEGEVTMIYRTAGNYHSALGNISQGVNHRILLC